MVCAGAEFKLLTSWGTAGIAGVGTGSEERGRAQFRRPGGTKVTAQDKALLYSKCCRSKDPKSPSTQAIPLDIPPSSKEGSVLPPGSADMAPHNLLCGVHPVSFLYNLLPVRQAQAVLPASDSLEASCPELRVTGGPRNAVAGYIKPTKQRVRQIISPKELVKL